MSEQTASTTEAAAVEAPAAPAADAPIQLPDDHPLVGALAAKKERIAALEAQAEAREAGVRTSEERIAALEERTKAAERAALVKSVQAKHGISDEDADLFLTGADQASLTKQAARLAGRADERTSKGNVAPTEGKTPSRNTTSTGEQFAEFFTQQLGG